MHRLVDPLFQSRTDFEIMTELTRRFGREKEYTRGMDEMEWVRSLYDECKKANEGKFAMPEFDEFWEKGFLDFSCPGFIRCEEEVPGELLRYRAPAD